MNKINVNETLKIRVRKYLEYIWKIENSANEKRCEEIFKELPKSLREELITQSRFAKIHKLSLFKSKFTDSTIQKIVNNLTHVRYSKEEWIYKVRRVHISYCNLYKFLKSSGG